MSEGVEAVKREFLEQHPNKNEKIGVGGGVNHREDELSQCSALSTQGQLGLAMSQGANQNLPVSQRTENIWEAPLMKLECG